ncbi:MAG: hypothetical protein ACJA1A_000861 [Saprospiraceae bacterium]|jgi:uncharacterized protein (DUF1800 family)
MNKLVKIFCMLLPFGLMGQSYTDYLGAGHDIGTTVTASSSNAKSPAENTLSGSGMDSKYFAASRFLQHATMGPSELMIEELLATNSDFDAWLENEFTKPPSYLTPEMEAIWDEIIAYYIGQGVDPNNIFGPYKLHFDYSYWETIMTNNDFLRHKIAHSLSQILVVSSNSDLGDWGSAMTGYYDILLDHSFGNYRDLLEEVSLSIQMGYYLSHLNNAKENPEANTSPDENYAREIMQLFTIGLYELNPDGTRMIDGNGDEIPTYDQNDIQEFAKVFTGLGIGEIIDPNNWPYQPFFGLDIWAAVKDVPMVMYEDFHETEEKYLLNGEVLPANQTGMTDISMAIDNLFNHANVGPFVGKLLIKRLVKSNPSPEYVNRVTNAFNDNGSGVRGDMQAVIKAILLDEEARSGQAMLAANAGRAKEPMMKISSFARIMPLNVPNGRYWSQGYDFSNNTGQHILSAPTVFNFYLPDFQPIGDIAEQNMTAPEFKLHNTSKAISSINQFWYLANYWGGTFFNSWEDVGLETAVSLDIQPFMPLADEPELLVNKLDKLLTFGQLSDQTRDNIIPILQATDSPWGDPILWQEERIRAAIYYILVSPDFNIMH